MSVFTLNSCDFFFPFADVHPHGVFAVVSLFSANLDFLETVSQGFSVLLYESCCIPVIILHSPPFCACCKLIFFLRVDDMVRAITDDVLSDWNDVSSGKGCCKGHVCYFQCCIILIVHCYVVMER